MTSKWIGEIRRQLWWDGKLKMSLGMFTALERVDKLLRQAMSETDNEQLHDAIREEIVDESSRTN